MLFVVAAAFDISDQRGITPATLLIEMVGEGEGGDRHRGASSLPPPLVIVIESMSMVAWWGMSRLLPRVPLCKAQHSHPFYVKCMLFPLVTVQGN